MTTDFRALCAELLSALEQEGYAHWTTTPDEDELCLRARVALAEPDGPAVSDDREPASVTAQPSDEELNRLWFETDGRVVLGAKEYARAVLARWGTPNLAENRRSLKNAWAAHQSAIEVAAKVGMDAFRAVPDLRDCPSIAAALRAAALVCKRDSAILLSLADELEGNND